VTQEALCTNVYRRFSACWFARCIGQESNHFLYPEASGVGADIVMESTSVVTKRFQV
jgi:hypothetical protein